MTAFPPGSRVTIGTGEVIGPAGQADTWVQCDPYGQVLVPTADLAPVSDVAAQLALALDALRDMTTLPPPGSGWATAFSKRRNRARDVLAQIARLSPPIDPRDIRDGDLVERVVTHTKRGTAVRFPGEDEPALIDSQLSTETTWRLIEAAPTEETA